MSSVHQNMVHQRSRLCVCVLYAPTFVVEPYLLSVQLARMALFAHCGQDLVSVLSRGMSGVALNLPELQLHETTGFSPWIVPWKAYIGWQSQQTYKCASSLLRLQWPQTAWYSLCATPCEVSVHRYGQQSDQMSVPSPLLSCSWTGVCGFLPLFPGEESNWSGAGHSGAAYKMQHFRCCFGGTPGEWVELDGADAQENSRESVQC